MECTSTDLGTGLGTGTGPITCSISANAASSFLGPTPALAPAAQALRPAANAAAAKRASMAWQKKR